MKTLLTVLLLSCFISSAHATDNKKTALEIKDINGKSYTIKGTPEGLNISGLEGKVIFLEFFGHECPPCLATIPHLIEMQSKHKDKLAILAVEVQGLTTQALKTFAKQKGMNYSIFSGEGHNERLFVSYISQRAQWQGGIPFLIALDPKGDVRYIQSGMLPKAALEELFEQLAKTK